MTVCRHVILYLEIYKYFLLVRNDCFPLEEVLCTDLTDLMVNLCIKDAPKVLSMFSINLEMFRLENV